MEKLFSMLASVVSMQAGAPIDPRAYAMIAAGFLAAMVIRRRAI